MQIDYGAIAPELALTVTALVVLLVDLVVKGDYKRVANPLAMLGTLVAIAFTIPLYGDEPARSTFGGMFVVNDYAVVFKLVFLFALLAILAVSLRYFAEGHYFQGEYYFLLVTAFVGMLLMPSARDLLLLFVALETVSIPGFVMAGLRKRDLYSSEAALKFFLIGVLSVAVMLFGMSFVYGFTGTTNLDGIAQALGAQSRPEPLLLASLLLVIVGFGFKVSAVPFHFWAPDTYAGAPLPVTAMLAVASKAAGFAGLVAICFIAFEPYAAVWGPVLGFLGVLTMSLGNLIALQQRDIVRLLAYSSIAQAGYMLLPFGVAVAGGGPIIVPPGGPQLTVNGLAVQGVLNYLLAYAIMNIGAFGVVIAVHRRTGHRAIADYAGLGSRAPGLALAMTIFLVSLGGLPPVIGFWAKFVVFQALLGGSAWVLAGLLVLNSVIALFYYLAVVRVMWFEESPAAVPRPHAGFVLSGAIGLLAVATVVVGLLPLYQNAEVGGDVAPAVVGTAE